MTENVIKKMRHVCTAGVILSTLWFFGLAAVVSGWVDQNNPWVKLPLQIGLFTVLPMTMVLCIGFIIHDTIVVPPPARKTD